jgi:DNA polymerase III sliding clamp (beta) subunit (PCNA family)
MNITLNGRELAEALTGLQRAMARKTNLAVLKHVRFHCEDQTVTASVTDLDHHTDYRFMDAAVSTLGTLLLPVKDLYRLVKSAKNDQVTLESTDNPQTAKIGLSGALGERTHFLPCMEAGEWPEASERIPVHPADDRFIPAYRSLIPFASTDPSRAVLNGITLQLGTGEHTLTATDGRRLCSFSGLTFHEDLQGIFPLLNIISWNRFPGDCKLGTTDKQYRIEAGNWTLQGRLVDGVYPNWKQVIPDVKDDDCVFQLADEDLQAVKQAVQTLPASHSETGGDKNAGICLMKQDGVVVLAACDARGNWVNQSLRHSTLSGTQYTAFNRSYFLEAVEAGFRRWQFKDNMAPLRAETENGIHVLMPIRVESVPGKVEAPALKETATIKPETQIKEEQQPMTEETKPPLTVLPSKEEAPEQDLLTMVQTARESCRTLNTVLKDITVKIRGDQRANKALHSELQNAKGVLEKLRDIAA